MAKYPDSLFPDHDFKEPDPPYNGKKRGHYGTPGTGPDGETCKTCTHLYRNHMAKTYLKCGLNRAKWTGGPASDIRAKDAACQHWENIDAC